MTNTARKQRFQKKEPKEFDEEVIQIDRVTRVVKGGRKLRFRATVVIGNRNGKVGIGVGKSNEVTGAIQKAIAQAKRYAQEVTLHDTTIPHEVQIKYKSSHIIFMPAAPGTGVIAGGPIRKVLELAGIKDVLSKSYGTTNKLNNSKATFEALIKLRETPMMKRGKAQKPQVEIAKPETEAEAEENAKPEPIAKKPVTNKTPAKTDKK